MHFLNFLETVTLEFSSEVLLVCCHNISLAVSIMFSACCKDNSVPYCFNLFSKAVHFVYCFASVTLTVLDLLLLSVFCDNISTCNGSDFQL